MKVKILSDTHNDHYFHDDLECDILIHCGDFGTKGNWTEAEAFLMWFVKQPAKYKVVVRGNHDVRKPAVLAKAQMLAREYGITFLYNESITINGIKMWGGSYVPAIKDGVYRDWHPLSVRSAAWKDMPDDLDLLITHVPPRDILDKNLEGYPCGCDQLTEAVRYRNIKRHVFGHIHEDGGKTLEMFDTKFYNCAVKNREYLTVRNYTEIEIDD